MLSLVLTQEQLSEVIVVRGLEKVEPSHVAEVGAELFRVSLAQHLHQFQTKSASVGAPDPEPDPHVFGLPDPGTDPDPAPDTTVPFSHKDVGRNEIMHEK